MNWAFGSFSCINVPDIALPGLCNRYASLAPLYYRGAAAAVVVYDITNTETFLKAQFWVKELQKHGNPDIVVALVGNKADLEDQREVTREVSTLSQ